MVAGKLKAIIEDLLDDPDWLKNVPEIAAWPLHFPAPAKA